MKFEKFVLSIFIPVIVFAIWSMDARAEDAENYNYYGDFTANGQSYNCRFRISYTKNGYNHIYESWFNSDNGKFALVLGAPDKTNITLYRMYNGELVRQTATSGNVYKDVGYGTYRSKTTSESTYKLNTDKNIWLPGYYSDAKDYVALAPIFDTAEHAKAYVQDGWTDGWLNEPEPPQTIKLDDFCLTGFNCDNTISASWTGINGAYYGYDFDESRISVRVDPTRMYMLNAGEEQVDVDAYGTDSVDFTDFSYSRAYSDYIPVDSPYRDRTVFMLSFVPEYYDPVENVIFVGAESLVTFSFDGEIESIDIPEADSVDNYDSGFYLNNFTATTEIVFPRSGSFVHCLWNGSSVDGVVNYLYSGFKIDLFVLEQEYIKNGEVPKTPERYMKWVAYPFDDDVFIRSNRLNLSLDNISAFCMDNGYTFFLGNVSPDLQIRVTPYYKLSGQIVYGHAYKIMLTSKGAIKDIVMSESNGLLDDAYVDIYQNFSEVVDMIGEQTKEDLDSLVDIDGNLDLYSLGKNFLSSSKGLLSMVGQFPALFARFFSFFPSWFYILLQISFTVAVILRILGR